MAIFTVSALLRSLIRMDAKLSAEDPSALKMGRTFIDLSSTRFTHPDIGGSGSALERLNLRQRSEEYSSRRHRAITVDQLLADHIAETVPSVIHVEKVLAQIYLRSFRTRDGGENGDTHVVRDRCTCIGGNILVIWKTVHACVIRSVKSDATSCLTSMSFKGGSGPFVNLATRGWSGDPSATEHGNLRAHPGSLNLG